MRLCFGKVSKLATAVTRVRLSNLSCSYNDFLGSLFNGMHFGHAAPRGGEFMNPATYQCEISSTCKGVSYFGCGVIGVFL